jgi:glyoxylase-like metal-dependent hydrolase (beta-lactamase superfamily II)
VGKTWSPEDFTSLVDDVEERLFGTLPDDTWVYPGHGKDTTRAPNGPTWTSGGRGAGERPPHGGRAEPGRRTGPAGSGSGRATGAGACDPGPVTEIGQAIAPVGASWRGIDGTPAPVHAHMVQW